MHWLQTFYYYVVPFVVILSLLVFVHELGHYLVARWNKVKVEVFSIGFGKELIGWTDRAGTRWKISLIPLGGYVRMFSDLNAASQPDMKIIRQMTEEEKQGSLFHKTVWQRISISAAGPVANYIFTILIFSILYGTVGQHLPTNEARIGFVQTGSPGEKAGLQKGDKVIEVEGKPLDTFQKLVEIVSSSPGKELNLKVLREDQEVPLKITVGEDTRQGQKVGKIGVGQGYEVVKRSLLVAPFYATYDAITITGKTLYSLGKMITRKIPADGLSGPIGIASMVAKIAEQSWVDLLWLTAFLSLNLGLINLLPIPMFDGGHLLYYFIEAIRGKPLSDKAQEIGFRIGLSIIIALALFATWNDLSRFKFFSAIKNLFS
jgi:regulator of sigma E protease